MKLAAISALAYRRAQRESIALAYRLTADRPYGEVVVDWASVSRQQGVVGFDLVDLSVIDMHRWVREEAESYQPDERAIVEDANSLPIERAVLLDASGYDLDTLRAVLDVARHAWFSLECWHPYFLLVVDEALLLPGGEALFNTFYVRPQALTIREVRQLERAFMHNAMLARWFGAHGGRLRRVFNGMLNLYKRVTGHAYEISGRKLQKWGI